MISLITDKVVDEIHTYHNRVLEENVYAFVFFDTLFFKMRENGKVFKKAKYSARSSDLAGQKDMLGIGEGGFQTIQTIFRTRFFRDNSGTTAFTSSFSSALSPPSWRLPVPYPPRGVSFPPPKTPCSRCSTGSL